MALSAVPEAPTAQRSLFPSASAPPNPPYKVFISVSLELAPEATSWGLTVSLFESRYLIIGSVSPLYVNAALGTSPVRGFWAANTPLDPSIFWRQSTVDVASFCKYLYRLPRSPTPPTLLPGDCILAIDGRPMSLFSTLSQTTDYLRQKRQLSLLIIRHPAAYSMAAQPSAVGSPKGCSPKVLGASLVYPLYRNLSPPTPGKLSAYAHAPLVRTVTPLAPNTACPKPKPVVRMPQYIPVVHTNPLFLNEVTGKPMRYTDDEFEYDPEEGRRSQLFLTPIDTHNFGGWLQTRKTKWRSNYKVHAVAVADQEFADESFDTTSSRDSSSVAVDFWTQQGHSSFQQWLYSSTGKWKQAYSWNQRKRKRLEHDCEVSVNLSTHSFEEWLSVRRTQWRILRRKRQRQKLEACPNNGNAADGSPDWNTPEAARAIAASSSQAAAFMPVPPALFEQSVAAPELLLIDALLEEQQERERLDAKQRSNIVDISFLFDQDVGCPDDVVTHCLRYLDPIEHGKLLGISNKTRKALKKRDAVWRQLCPGHWTLPRRPRKPWYELYLVQLESETKRQRKRWDDLLSTASSILEKSDQVQAIEKMVTEAERDYGYKVDYSSGVVCERNSLLNLAVIHGRQKVVKWMVEGKSGKKADIETCDRGSFTPLLNAAWNGDRYLVRFLLQKGADRLKIGFGHYTKALAHPDFEGLTAAGWADKKGHPEVARLIRIGL